MDRRIPIQNIYYLFCYAWNRFEEGKSVEVGAVDSPHLLDLLAKVLSNGIYHLLRRRGVDRGYVDQVDELPLIRGRLDVTTNMLPLTLRSHHLRCQFDALEIDILPNQILKATLVRLASTKELAPLVRGDIARVLRKFDAIGAIRLAKSSFRQVQIHRNNSFYDFLLKVCQLVHDATLPTPDGKGYRFSDVLTDEKKMARVFEQFLRNFFRIEQRELSVEPLHLRWDAIAEPESLALLPGMRTDIHISKDDRHIIIDAKYYAEALQQFYGKKSIASGHLYQLFAYLKNAEPLDASYQNAEGILIYPAVGDPLDFGAALQGHPVRAVTLNLDRPWPLIRHQLLSLLDTPPRRGAVRAG